MFKITKNTFVTAYRVLVGKPGGKRLFGYQGVAGEIVLQLT